MADRWFSQGGKVSQVEKAVYLGEVAWLVGKCQRNFNQDLTPRWVVLVSGEFWTKVRETVQILQTIQVALLLLRFGCKISAMPGTSPPSIEPDRLSGFRRARGGGGKSRGLCQTIFKFYLLAGRAGVESGIFLCLNISRDQLFHKLPRSNLCHRVFLGTCTF